MPGKPRDQGYGTKAPYPKSTNNIAEYFAMGVGLKRVFELAVADPNYEGIEIYGDSRLVIEQVNLKWQVKAEHLRPLHQRTLAILAELKKLAPWGAEWISRDKNGDADKLSRQAYFEAEGKWPPERNK